MRDETIVAIPKASRLPHVEANAAAGDLELSPEDLKKIDEAFPPAPPNRRLPIL